MMRMPAVTLATASAVMCVMIGMSMPVRTMVILAGAAVGVPAGTFVMAAMAAAMMPAMAMPGGAMVPAGRAAVVVPAARAVMGITTVPSRVTARVLLTAVSGRFVGFGGMIVFARIVPAEEIIPLGQTGNGQCPGDDGEEEHSVHN